MGRENGREEGLGARREGRGVGRRKRGAVWDVVWDEGTGIGRRAVWNREGEG